MARLTSVNDEVCIRTAENIWDQVGGQVGKRGFIDGLSAALADGETISEASERIGEGGVFKRKGVFSSDCACMAYGGYRLASQALSEGRVRARGAFGSLGFLGIFGMPLLCDTRGFFQAVA